MTGESIPRSYGYPWPEVLTDEGPFDVALSGSPVTGEQAYLKINQCLWKLVGGNHAGRTLLELEAELLHTLSRDASGDAIYAWESLLPQVMEAYDQGPELWVQFADHCPYRLILRTRRALVVAGLAKRRGAGVTPGFLRYSSSVLSTTHLMHGFKLEDETDAVDEPSRIVWVRYSDWQLERGTPELSVKMYPIG